MLYICYIYVIYIYICYIYIKVQFHFQTKNQFPFRAIECTLSVHGKSYLKGLFNYCL